MIKKKLLEKVTANQDKICEWLNSEEKDRDLPFYTSVDIRESDYKVAAVDTNLYPAGFNNLCFQKLKYATEVVRNAIQSRVPHCKEVLLIAEEHTRNKWYLEHVSVLKEVINQAGFNVTPASFFDAHPEVCEKTGFLELETASGRPLKMYCLDFLQKEMAAGRRNFCMVVLNHDLTKGIPQILLDLEIPIFPSFRSGWHARSKAHHFSCANGLIHSFSKMIDEDPWHFSCLFETVDEVDINIDSDRENLERATQSLMDRISEKYAENGISEKPFVFMKSDSGTYGMAIHIIEDAADIRSLNRKARNKLAKGKQGKETNRFILQEGIPSNTQIDGQTSELCIYQIENHYLGGFYRVNEKKNDRGNLNSDGMSFRRMCETHAVDQNCATQPGANLLGIQECGRQPDPHVQIDRILARIAGIAASIEVKELIEGVRR